MDRGLLQMRMNKSAVEHEEHCWRSVYERTLDSTLNKNWVLYFRPHVDVLSTLHFGGKRGALSIVKDEEVLDG